MLDDALRQLDELFLLVIVGEFNSGKSSVINALLGSKFLDSGILPTTNEISVLKFSNDGTDTSRRDQVSLLCSSLLTMIKSLEKVWTRIMESALNGNAAALLSIGSCTDLWSNVYSKDPDRANAMPVSVQEVLCGLICKD